MRILVAEDERDLNRTIEKKLRSEGYVVDCCFDGRDAADYLRLTEYDAAILDIMMPEKDGYRVVREIREAGIDTPILFLTARDTIDDKVQGLDIGADDYMVKPFSFKELMARLRVITRKRAGSATNIYKVHDLIMDTSAHSVKRDGIEISLTAKEFALLELLLRNKNQVLSREQIENHLWDMSGSGSGAVDVYIRYLRKKLDDSFRVKLIQTVRGAGYVIREK